MPLLEMSLALDRQVRWRGLHADSLELCHIAGQHCRAAIVTPSYGLFYRFGRDAGGCVRTLSIERTDGAAMNLIADGQGSWSDPESTLISHLSGCIDIDISATPMTNALPIWRMPWTTDTPQHFAMAWIDTDAMSAQRDEQIYTRLDETHFRYQAADGSFERVIEIDADGLVLHYPGLFERD